jgi:hypothetical protein
MTSKQYLATGYVNIGKLSKFVQDRGVRKQVTISDTQGLPISIHKR